MAPLREIRDLISANLPVLTKCPGFVLARPGFQFTEAGEATQTPAIIVVTRDANAIPAKFPKKIKGVPVEVVQASATHAPSSTDIATPEEAEALATMPPPVDAEALSPYQPPVQLTQQLNQRVNEAMKVTCHVSPDAGWPVLQPFLNGSRQSLTIAMYDLTAPHIDTALVGAKAALTESFKLVLDPKISLDDGTKANDLQETVVRDNLQNAGGPRLDFVWAAVTDNGKTTGGIFPSAYHIKVAVRDHSQFWLSSGNMQSTNQPNLPLVSSMNPAPATLYDDFNREWHVVVEHQGLAQLYENFIKFDFVSALPFQVDPSSTGAQEAGSLAAVAAQSAGAPTFFDPLVVNDTINVQPVLTPDNYVDQVLPVLEDATATIDFQNQYIHLPKVPSGALLSLLQTLLRKQQQGVTLRIILRDIGDTRPMREALIAFGFDPKSIRLQKNCHNKGIIIDRKIVVLGSHNYSSEGVARNRDASLIFFDPRIAQYYGQVFEFDWNNLATVASLSAPTSVNALAAANPKDIDFEEDGGPKV